MRWAPILLLFMLLLPQRVCALELEAPAVPPSAEERMPENTSSFAEGLQGLLRKCLGQIRPDLKESAESCLSIAASVMLVSLLKIFEKEPFGTVDLVGAAVIAIPMLMNSNAMIRLATDTITDLSEYGKLLLPVMAAATVAHGGNITSTALYTGTAAFDVILSSLISNILVPGVYLFLALALGHSALGEDILKKLRDFVRWIISWCLKTLLTVFTTYMSITGVVSGTTDAAALKAAKVTISSVVPVVGGILSDASEAVLVSAGLVKNAAGIYGILAILAVFLEPFLRIGVHYMVLKLTSAVCGMFGTKQITGLIEDYGSAMGLLLAMTGSVCLLLLISTVCFLKGVA